MADSFATSGRSRDIHWARPNTAPAEAQRTKTTMPKKNFQGKRRTPVRTEDGIRYMGSFDRAGTT
jgi:hypothetical protein